MNFLTMILVGRVAGAHQLGLFALGLSIVYLLLAVQESIITTPATIVSPRLSEDERRRYFGASLTLQAALSLIICAVLLLAACATWLVTNEAESAIGLAVLALAAPMWCLREFCRRLAFAQLNARSVLALDVCAALLLGGGLAGLIVTGHFTAATAFAAVGLATGVSAVCWLMLRRRHFELHVREIGSALRENLVVGKWILSGQATSIATAEAMPWIIAGMLGTEATGVFAACRSVFRVANPLVVTVSNLITPYAAHAYAAGGRPQVHAIVRSAMLGMGALMTAFLLVLAVIGGDLLGLLFQRQFARSLFDHANRDQPARREWVGPRRARVGGGRRPPRARRPVPTVRSRRPGDTLPPGSGVRPRRPRGDRTRLAAPCCWPASCR